MQDCSGLADSDETESIISTGDACIESKDRSYPETAYQKQSCSDDGTSISIPYYSDPDCTSESNMNTEGPCEGAIPGLLECTFPPHMTFQSGKCTQVLSGLVEMSWKVTITDCAGDELSQILAGGFVAIFFFIILPICCLCACIVMCVKRSQQTPAPAAGEGIYTSAPTGAASHV